uniref:Uncharacterized protein n=1 Tax=Glossina pallidipes TaxID=7398 RepID=A0A1A9Z3Y9_GLOPL
MSFNGVKIGIPQNEEMTSPIVKIAHSKNIAAIESFDWYFFRTTAGGNTLSAVSPRHLLQLLYSLLTPQCCAHHKIVVDDIVDHRFSNQTALKFSNDLKENLTEPFRAQHHSKHILFNIVDKVKAMKDNVTTPRNWVAEPSAFIFKPESSKNFVFGLAPVPNISKLQGNVVSSLNTTFSTSPSLLPSISLMPLFIIIFTLFSQGNESSPGKSSISPVLMLKQAPCHGQRIRPSPKTPVCKGAPQNDENIWKEL